MKYVDSTVETILRLLQEQGKQQKELTDYLGVGKQTVSDWKNGKTKSYLKHIDKIAYFFNVSIDHLLGKDTAISKDEENGQKNNATDNSDIPSESLALNISDSELTDILNRLSDKSLSELESYLDYLLWKQDQES